MDPKRQMKLSKWISQHPVWGSIAIYAALVALTFGFVDLMYRSHIDDLHRKIEDKNIELAALREANSQLKSGLFTSETDLPNISEASSKTPGVNRNEGFGPTSLHLSKGHPVFFWENRGRITLQSTYQSLGTIAVQCYLDDKEFSWDLYIDRRFQFSFRGIQYFADVAEIGPDIARLNIFKKNSN